MSHPYRKHPVQTSVRARRKVPWKVLGIFTLSAVVMFGIGAPAATAMATPERARSTRVVASR